MKNHLPILLLSFILLNTTHAQDWRPVHPGQTTYFNTDMGGVFILKTDSVYAVNGDSVFMNRATYYGKDTCAKKFTQPNILYPYSPIDKLIKTSDGWKINTRTRQWDTSGSWMFFPLVYDVNDTWHAKQPDGQIAECTCIHEKDTLIFDEEDYIRTINCRSNTNSYAYIISHAHGLIKVHTPNELNMIGITKNAINKGQVLNSFKETFLPQVGDILCYEEKAVYGVTKDIQYRDSIVSISRGTDNFTLTISSVAYDMQTGIETKLTNRNQVYPIHQLDEMMKAPDGAVYPLSDSGESIEVGFAMEILFNHSYLGLQLQTRRITVKENSFERSSCLLERNHEESGEKLFSMQLGLLDTIFNNGFGPYYRKKLIGLKLNNMTYGIINVGINELTDNKLNFHPNPASDNLYIETEKELEYAIYSTTGKLLQRGNTNKIISVANLTPGLYVLLINQSFTKFIKQ